MLRMPPARRTPSGTAPAVPARAAAATPDRLTNDRSMGTLKTGAVQVDVCYVPMSRRFLLPIFALCALLALIPSRAVAHDGPYNGGAAPTARTDAATAITATGATLNGFVGTNGRATQYTFAYGVTVSSVKFAPDPPGVVPAGQGAPVSVTVTGLTPGTTYHVRLITRYAAKAVTIGNDISFTTLAAPLIGPAPAPAPAPGGAAPTPSLGESVVVAPVKGDVLVKTPGAADYAPLAAGGAVPTGAVVDTRKGQVALTTALTGGKTQTATFERGVFQVRQSRSGKGLTDIYLRGPALDCSSSRSSGRAAAVARKKPRQRQLWGRDKGGRFRTHGANSVATVRGTSWITTDTCSGTRTTVKAGAVSVRDVHRHRTVVVRKGHSYLARRR